MGRYILVTAIGLALVGCESRAADSASNVARATDPAAQTVQFGMAVMVPPDAAPEFKAQAERLSKILGRPDRAVIEVANNPTCAFWIEFWTPNPTKEGYVVIIQAGGGRIIATSMNELKKAIDHVARVRVAKTGAVPVGVLTNFDVAK